MSSNGKEERIFVQIASYRDPDCQWTVKDLFDYAANPDRVYVGVCWQFVPELDQDCFVEKTRPAQVRTVEYHVRDAKGVCWARHLTQKLWRGEEFTMQIDSHMRFERGWDETLIGMLKACPSERPVLTTYPMGFKPPREITGRGWVPKPTAKEFNEHRILIFGSRSVVEAEAPAKPMLHAFLAGGFVFGPSSMISDVPYDPYQYFTGEEVSVAVRLWTHGYDLYAPNCPVLYHNYERQSSARHWSDDKQWVALSNRSFVRLRHLFGTERTTDPEALREIDQYGFGRVRSLQDYERFTGISFKNRTVSERAKTFYFPFLTKEEAEAAQKKAPARRGMTVRNLTVTMRAPGVSITAGHRPRLVHEGPRLVIYDNFLPPGHLEKIQAWAAAQDYQRTSTSVGGSSVRPLPNGLPLRSSTEVSYVAGVRRHSTNVYPSNTALDLLIALIAHMGPEIAHIVGESRKAWNHFSASALLYPRESGLALRWDDSDSFTGAFTFFASPAWNVHWGGLLMVFDRATAIGETPRDPRVGGEGWTSGRLEAESDLALSGDPGFATCVLPRPNRIAFIRPDTHYTVTPVTPAAGDRVQLTVSGSFVR